jgi:hypothetical protein
MPLEETIALLIFLIVCVFMSIALHNKTKSILVPALVVAICTNAIFQLYLFISLGFINPYIHRSFLIGLFIAFITSLTIGVIVKAGR